MMSLWQKLCRVGAVAWLRIVQSLNAIAMSLLGAAIVVHQAYPQIISGAIAKLPPMMGIPLIFAFGLIVHFAIRRAKKEIQ
jgi:hypothetical protein